ncbi:MAG: SulP family inorganic anion transporter, partial [Actinomycetota bacterium]|nr:SulP family inorganic anion transporter [Actinomycetota bacterium]
MTSGTARHVEGGGTDRRDPGLLARVVRTAVPGWETARRYRRAWLGPDLVAGVVLATLLVPQGMAYAELAGLPAVTGLYTTATGLVAYALFGPSRILVVGPDSALAPLILAAVTGTLAVAGPGDAVALAGMLAILMGLCSLVVGAVGLGTIAELLSKPVRVGYLAGLAVIVLVSQLPKLFGFSTSADGFVEELSAFVDGVRDGAIEPAALAGGLGCLVTIAVLGRWLPVVPGVLVAAVGATVAVAGLDLAARVPVVGDVPSGMPELTWPSVSGDQFETLLVAAIGITFVGLADTTALSRSLGARRGEQVDPNREIAAMGVANVATGLFGGFPISASASRTAVAERAGARSQLAGLLGAVAVLAVLGVATGAFRYLPQSALAAIVVVAAFGL